MRLPVVLALSGLLAAGCGDDGQTPDAARPDAARPDAPVDAVACAEPQEFTGELVDFDSTEATFLGVFDAVYTVRGLPACSDHTSPNGRFIVDIPAADTILDVDAPSTYVDGVAVVPRATITTPNVLFSQRSFTAARADALYTSLGQTFDATKGHVLVYQAVDLDTFALTGATGVTIGATAGNDWAAGNGTRYVMFTNVDPGTQTLSATAPSTVGVGDVPVEAGKITYVATVFVLD